jgi:hypothetical protein
MLPNPFEVLHLDPTASPEEIVRQAGRLRQRATDEATRNSIRQAVQALTASAEDRRLLALLTHSSPCYHWPALERFAALFRRPPVVSEPPRCPALDLAEFVALLKEQAAEELALAPPSFEPVGTADDAAEIDQQTAEAMWQSLLFEPRG